MTTTVHLTRTQVLELAIRFPDATCADPSPRLRYCKLT